MGERVPDSRPHEKRGGGLQGCDATRLKAGAKKKEAKKKTANHDNDRQARLPGTVCNRIERIATAAWPIGKKKSSSRYTRRTKGAAQMACRLRPGERNDGDGQIGCGCRWRRLVSNPYSANGGVFLFLARCPDVELD